MPAGAMLGHAGAHAGAARMKRCSVGHPPPRSLPAGGSHPPLGSAGEEGCPVEVWAPPHPPHTPGAGKSAGGTKRCRFGRAGRSTASGGVLEQRREGGGGCVVKALSSRGGFAGVPAAQTCHRGARLGQGAQRERAPPPLPSAQRLLPQEALHQSQALCYPQGGGAVREGGAAFAPPATLGLRRGVLVAVTAVKPYGRPGCSLQHGL